MDFQIRDPVHNFVSLREKEVELLATRPLQRLRGIRQLALACLVYPGALHTRFDHTLGVVHVAGQMAQTLGLDPDDVDLIRHAALLHDIGHGPFSHVSEHVLEIYGDRNALSPEQKNDKIHELITSHMIRTDPEIRRILGEKECNKIVNLLMEGHGEQVNHSIVSGPLDADKQDYLLRDSYFCGVAYGVFDLHQLHRSIVLKGDNDDRYLMLKPDGVHAAEQFALAKYYLTTNVYRHKVRLITDQMIIRAIILGIETDKIAKLRDLYSFNNSDKFTAEYARWDDAKFINTFGRSKTHANTKCQEMLRRLEERKLLKRVFQAKPTDFPPEIRDSLKNIGRDTDGKRKLEHEIAEKLSALLESNIDPAFVILNVYDIKSVKEMSRNDEAGIMIAKDPAPVPFEEESALFKSINEGYKEESVEVYAPVEWQTPAERKEIIRKVHEPIQEIIGKYFGNKQG